MLTSVAAERSLATARGGGCCQLKKKVKHSIRLPPRPPVRFFALRDSQPSRNTPRKTGSASLSFQRLSTSDSIRWNSRRAIDRRYLRRPIFDHHFAYMWSERPGRRVPARFPPPASYVVTSTHLTASSAAIKISSPVFGAIFSN